MKAGYKGGNGTGPLCYGEILLGVRPSELAKECLKYRVCFGVTDVNTGYDDMIR